MDYVFCKIVNYFFKRQPWIRTATATSSTNANIDPVTGHKWKKTTLPGTGRLPGCRKVVPSRTTFFDHNRGREKFPNRENTNSWEKKKFSAKTYYYFATSSR